MSSALRVSDRFVALIALACGLVAGPGCLEKGARPGAAGGDGGAVGGDSTPADALSGDPAPGDEALPPPPVLEGNNASRALGFELFYRERLNRHLVIFNRYNIAGDVGFAVATGNNRIAKSGNDYEVIAGPNDNNPIGKVTYEAAQAYKMFGGHELELTLIRLFEGLTFLEAVSGHPGLTNRMAVPGWTVTFDGVTDTVTRTRNGTSVVPPVVYAPALETAILDTFFAGTRFTYWEDPSEQYTLRYPLMRMDDYAVTWVFSGLPTFLRISNCCASYIISQKGIWQGAYWSNHNSRDNFPDLMMGYLAAVDLLRDPTLPSDLWISAQRARVAGERVGGRIIADGSKLMTVSEFKSYDDLIPGGQTRPDLRTENGDLGSLNTCQLVYLAQAMSPAGLDVPVPVLPLGDSGENMAFRELMRLVGVNGGNGQTTECHSLDDAVGGQTWGDLLTAEVLGVNWLELLKVLAAERPEDFVGTVQGGMDDFEFLELSAAATVYYARVAGRAELETVARETLSNLILLHRAMADALVAAAGDPPDAGLLASAAYSRYLAAVIAETYGIDTAVEDYGGFAQGRAVLQEEDRWWNIPDTTPATLLTDAQITAFVENELASKATDEPWIVDRYRARFGTTPPLRRAGDGYEAIDMHGAWVATANSHHLQYGKHRLFFEVPLCEQTPDVLSCAWARLGCARPDLDDSGIVDAADQALFDAARLASTGLPCRPANDWCQGADLDRNYVVDDDDAAFMTAAQGCVR